MCAKVKGILCCTSWEPFTDIYVTGEKSVVCKV